MTNPLYRRHGGHPAPLPPIAFDDGNNAYTAPYAEADLAHLGFVLAPPRPDDTETQTAEWDASAEAWLMVDRPPPPPVPEPDPPQPVILTVGQFVGRFRVPDEENAFAQIDDLMMLESRLVRRNWQNDRFEFREDDGFWTILRGHAASVMPTARVAELFAAWAGSAFAVTPADEAVAA